MHFRICANEIKISTLRAPAPWTSGLSAPRVARRFRRRTDAPRAPLWTSPTPRLLRPFPRRGPRLRAPLCRASHAPCMPLARWPLAWTARASYRSPSASSCRSTCQLEPSRTPFPLSFHSAGHRRRPPVTTCPGKYRTIA
jgi:hypothetical protein